MTDSSKRWDVIVVGGGAAGLMTAASAIRCGRKVLLLEKNNKLGVKILMSGGTRCNITHACDSNEIVKAFGKPGKFLHSSLAALPPDEVVALVESEGVATKVEPGGKVFPCSDRAIDVRDALVRLATDPKQPGSSKLLTGVACRDIVRDVDGFNVQAESDVFQASSVVITTGGMSYPGCGTTGDGYGWAQQMGHALIDPVAALTPIVNDQCWSRPLKGITFDNVALKVQPDPDASQSNGFVLDRRSGGFLFTHFGYSGPSVLDISRVVSKHQSPNSLELVCDFAPDKSVERLFQDLLVPLQQRAKQTVLNVFSDQLPRRFVEAGLNELGLDTGRKAGEFGKNQINKFIGLVKGARFPIRNTYGFAKAEVTSGGVDLATVDSRTMQSKLQAGLFFAGEVLDLDGPIGGYNFQSAFSTGWLAGQSC